MSDVEDTLAAALTRIAAQAPQAGGLADGARRRHRRRRQRRAVVAGVAAILVVVAGASTLARTTPQADRVASPSRADDWQTIRQGDVMAEVPGDWRRHECHGRLVYAAVDPCTNWTGAGFSSGATYDAAMQAGVILRYPDDDREWSGYVYVGQDVLSVSDPDKDLVRQVLASARLDGQPIVDGSHWDFKDCGAISYEVPVDWGVPSGDAADYSVCVMPAREHTAPDGQLDVRRFRASRVIDAAAVTVIAPTRAVADLVLGSVDVLASTVGRRDRCPSEDERLVPVEAAGVNLQVPRAWKAHRCGELPQFGPGPGCRTSNDDEGVQFLRAATFQPSMDEREIVRHGGVWGGFVRRGEYAIFVTARDGLTVLDVLDHVQ